MTAPERAALTFRPVRPEQDDAVVSYSPSGVVRVSVIGTPTSYPDGRRSPRIARAVAAALGYAPGAVGKREPRTRAKLHATHLVDVFIVRPLADVAGVDDKGHPYAAALHKGEGFILDDER